jgi:hypothetical protein
MSAENPSPGWRRWPFAAGKALGLPERSKRRIYFRIPCGQTAVVSVIWMSRREWRRRPEASSSSWHVWHLGAYCLAVRLDL